MVRVEHGDLVAPFETAKRQREFKLNLAGSKQRTSDEQLNR